MRKVIYKWFWAWNYEKEEKWLNEMAAKGLALTGVGFCRYEFEECKPGEYQLRIELLENHLHHPENEQYIRFLEETGVEQVGSYMRWVYFRKRSADGPFELFSDNTSRMKHLNRILGLFIPFLLLNLGIGLNNIGLYFANGMAGNLLGIVNLLLAALLGLGTVKIIRQKNKLKKEQQIFEG